MEENPNNFVRPSVVNWNHPVVNPAFLFQLSYALTSERERNYMMLKELDENKRKNQELENYLSTYLNLKPKIPRVSSSDSLASTAADFDEVKMCVGHYTADERKLKILKYKLKQKRYREKVKLSRKFNGRSMIAKKKLRIKGKFVKSEALP